MRDLKFIPEYIKVSQSSYQNRKNDAPNGSIIPYSDNIGIKRLIEKKYKKVKNYIPNAPLGGYHIMIENYNYDNIELFHPDGCTLSITSYNVSVLLRECTIIKGTIQDELVAIWDSTLENYALIPFNGDTYNEVKIQSDEFFKAKAVTELRLGCSVKFGQITYTYYGTAYYIEHDPYKGYGAKSVPRMILCSSDGKFFLSTKRNPDMIVENPNSTVKTEDFFIEYYTGIDLYKINHINATGYVSTDRLSSSSYILRETPFKMVDLEPELIPKDRNNYGHPAICVLNKPQGEELYLLRYGYYTDIADICSECGKLVHLDNLQNMGICDKSNDPDGTYITITRRDDIKGVYTIKWKDKK